MNRKSFIASTVALGTVISPRAWYRTAPQAGDPALVIPPYLQYGDIIGIACPAGDIRLEEIKPALDQIEKWGLQWRIGESVGKKDFVFGGTDLERAQDFQQMLDDPKVNAILCARGGYGAIRIIDRLDFRHFVEKPKWIIGFSDITVLHCHVNRNFNIASLHSKMCNSFPEDWSKAESGQWQSILSIPRALLGDNMSYSVQPDPNNRMGSARGQLVGGNLKTLETLAGTKSDIDTKGKILMLEDTGEYLYSTDRMFWNLKRTGKLDGLSGLIIGGFRTKPDDPGEEFGRTLYDIVMEQVRDFNYPVCFNFPVGHQKENYAMKLSVVHQFEVRPDGVTLTALG